jgi:hypothetical protein
MAKMTVTRLFVGGFVAVAIGVVIALAAVLYAIAGGAITIGGAQGVFVKGGDLAGALLWLIIASLAIVSGTIAAIAAWLGALLNTAQLADKTWFVLVLLLGVFSLGWVAMLAYVLAGPDSTRSGRRASAMTTEARP